MASLFPINAQTPGPASGVTDAGATERDCRTCGLRERCISYGWMSPAGLWFENAVVLRPPPGCRGYVGRSADILGHFGVAPDEGATPRRRR
ncbi:MAG: hypothetical protein OEL76_10885 [Siculibacillus sp.]|nr:hypothetical protein [Siculibacillus sp.]